MANQYLTTQDVLWINHQITGESYAFREAELLEVVSQQYTYGANHDFLSNAARFATAFQGRDVIDHAGLATNFVALLAFSKLNGYDVTLTDEAAAGWYTEIGKDRFKAAEALEVGLRREEHQHDSHNPPVRVTVQDVIAAYPETIKKLLA